MSANHGDLLKKGLDLLLPIPGEGPKNKNMEQGFYNLIFYIKKMSSPPRSGFKNQ